MGRRDGLACPHHPIRRLPALCKAGKGPAPLSPWENRLVGGRVACAERWGAVAAQAEPPGGDRLVSIREPWSAVWARRQSWGWLW